MASAVPSARGGKRTKGFDSAPKSGKKGGKHTQTGTGKKKVAERDMADQRMQQEQQPIDPFTDLMKAASRNAQMAYTPATQGAADPNDPANISPDAIQNMPQIKRMR
jgi:hypothetical protein